MFSKKSIRVRFLLQLSVAMATLLIFFSTILYSYISYSVNKQLEDSIIKHANYLFATYPDIEQMVDTQKDVIKETLNVEVEIGKLPSSLPFLTSLRRYNENNRNYIELRIPYATNKITSKHQYLSIKGDVTQQLKVKAQVYQGIIFISIITMGIIIIYAFFISNMLTTPIKILTSNLSKMDETTIKTINTNNLPTEFRPLAKSINSLFMRIQNFIKYKKELFIGSAHELKTPLAVMKTKNQVTLMKKNSSKEELIEAVKQNIISIDEMNKIVSSILEFGRAEGAQLDNPETIDVIKYLDEKMNGFAILANGQNKKFNYELTPETLIMTLQPMLLLQIIQNFVQNALKFTPNDKIVFLKSEVKNGFFIITVTDEGCGISTDKDIFAPFVRSESSSGVGLGLFLAKSASEALGAEISLSNRKPNNGAIAMFKMKIGNIKN